MEESVKVVVTEYPPPRRVADRVTVVEQISHQRAGRNPISYPSSFTRELKTSEQPYSREITVGPEWQPLDTGWIAECGQLSIVNKAGSFPYQRQPTKEQLEESAKQILEVGDRFSEFRWRIPAGESLRGFPSDAKLLFIRSQHGTITCIITLIPA